MAGFCTNCGQPLMDGAAFCTSCGHKVVSPAANTNQDMTQQPPGNTTPAGYQQPTPAGYQPPSPTGYQQPAPAGYQQQAPVPPFQTGPAGNAAAGLWLKLRREKQWYLVNPAMEITIDQGQPCSLENGQEIVIPITPGPHRLHFSCHVRNHDMDIFVQGNMCVQISWDRLWGSIKTEVQPF